MVSSSFAILDEELPVNFVFKNYSWVRPVLNEERRVFITFTEKHSIGNHKIINGKIVEYKITTKSKTITDKNNSTPYVSKKTIIEPYEIMFQILDKRYVKTLKQGDIKLLVQNLNRTTPAKCNFRYIHFNIKGLNDNYPNQWYADMNQTGHAAKNIKATGEDLVTDDKIGGNYFKKADKKDIGINESIDGIPVKCQIHNNGKVLFPQKILDEPNYQPQVDEFTEFFFNVLVPYVHIGTQVVTHNFSR